MNKRFVLTIAILFFCTGKISSMDTFVSKIPMSVGVGLIPVGGVISLFGSHMAYSVEFKNRVWESVYRHNFGFCGSAAEWAETNLRIEKRGNFLVGLGAGIAILGLAKTVCNLTR